MLPVSTYSFMLSQTNIMNDTSRLAQKLATQLSDSRKSTDLAENPDQDRILNMTLTKNNRNTYVKSCDLLQITTGQYSVSLQHLETIIKNSLKQVMAVRSTYTNQIATNPLGAPAGTPQTEIDNYAAFKNLGNSAMQYLSDTTISLNEQLASGDGFLYSGLRATASGAPTYTLPPVRDLNTLPYFTSPTKAPLPLSPTPPGYPIPPNLLAANHQPYAPFTGIGVNPVTGAGTNPLYQISALAAVVTPAIDPTVTGQVAINGVAGNFDGLPVYDSDFGKSFPAAPLPDTIQQAWGTHNVTVDDKQTVGINFSSNLPAFQNLINGLRAAKTAGDQAGNYSTAERDAYMDFAYTSLTHALNGGVDPTTGTWTLGIRDLEARNAQTELTAQVKSNLHTSSLGVIDTRLNSLIGIDTTQVTVELATANNQLQASYKATASLLGLSLLNFLH